MRPRDIHYREKLKTREENSEYQLSLQQQKVRVLLGRYCHKNIGNPYRINRSENNHTEGKGEVRKQESAAS
jgi:hypothetical protein